MVGTMMPARILCSSVEFSCRVDDKIEDNDKTSCQLLIGNSFCLVVSQSILNNQSVVYNFEYSIAGKTVQEPIKDGRLMFAKLSSVKLTGNETKEILVDTAMGENMAGSLRVALNSSKTSRMRVVDITITRSKWLREVGAVIGWIYFLAWSVSFYPQVWINFKRKSVVGLNFDYIALNIMGYLCYAIYSLSLFFNQSIRGVFLQEHPMGVIQVDPNDIFFVLHAIALTLIIITQCLIYEKDDQTVSKTCRIILLAMFLYAIVVLTLAGTQIINWLRLVQYLSYVKLVVTLIKYVPQAFMNYKRQSTEGWSIENILLDFTGGSLSILQMFLKSYNNDDWQSIFGNVTKIGIGIFTIIFDTLFILQHYVFYNNEESQKCETTKDDNLTKGELSSV